LDGSIEESEKSFEEVKAAACPTLPSKTTSKGTSENLGLCDRMNRTKLPDQHLVSLMTVFQEK
jgi:hypothetical protein